MNMTTSTMVQVGDIAYYMRQVAEPTLSIGSGQADQRCTVFQFGVAHITGTFLKSTTRRFEDCDDVWSKQFLLNIVLQTDSKELLLPNLTIKLDIQKLLKKLGNQGIYLVRKEWLPVCIGITGANGSDLMLAEIVRNFLGTCDQVELTPLREQYESVTR